MKTYSLFCSTTLAIMVLATVLPNLSAAPANAEYASTAAMTAWEQANFNPPTLWFLMDFSHGETQYTEADDTLDYSHSYDSTISYPNDFTWCWGSNAPSQQEQDDVEYEFCMYAFAQHDNIGPYGIVFEDRGNYTVGNKDLTLVRRGFCRGYTYDEIQYGMYGAEVNGAEGEVRITLRTWPVGQSENEQNSDDVIDNFGLAWDSYAWFSDPISPAAGSVNVRILGFGHP